MKEIRILMGMPITVEILDENVPTSLIHSVFEYFTYIDNKFSTYKSDSEISKINRSEILPGNFSYDMQTVFTLAEETRKITNGYFNIRTPQNIYDPSGLVKGWAILNAARILENAGIKDYYIEAGGDIQCQKFNNKEPWRVGIRNPFNIDEVVKVVALNSGGVATSGTYIRGDHIYGPNGNKIEDIISFTVLGPNIYEADRFATAAFAMGKEGINFIESLPSMEGYVIDKNGIAIITTGFSKFAVN